ncbi:MAG TPA: hypothetical protein DHW45_20565 [Candidatus Latescibacteria bacterium]|nr:hypothetical protein [Candidatus Latescibacterota bacterium]
MTNVPPYRILNVITRIEQGGAPLALLETVKRMDRGLFDISLAIGQAEDRDRDLDPVSIDVGLRIHQIPELRRSVHPVRDLVALIKLIGIIRAGEYDLVHTHTSKAGLLGRIAASYCGVPAIVHSSHGSILDGYFSPSLTSIFAQFEKFAASISDKIICLTREEIGRNLEAGIGSESQYTYIFNGIDISGFEHRRGNRDLLRREFQFGPDDHVCVTVGRLVPIKGQSDLLEAFAIAHRNNPRLKLLLVGDGELRTILESRIRDLNITEATHLAGWRNDVAELLDACDLFVLTSLNEGLGLVLIEAMAKKLAVVATKVGGVSEVVEDGKTGRLVSAQDTEAIGSAIAELTSNNETRLRMGESGYERAKAFFSIDQTVRNTENLYRDLLAWKSL